MKKKNRTSSPLKRCFCGLVALTMTLPLLSGCSGNDNGQQTSSGSSVSVVSSVQESTAPSVSDASASERPVHINPSTVNDPFIYYNIVKKALK